MQHFGIKLGVDKRKNLTNQGESAGLMRIIRKCCVVNDRPQQINK